MVKKEVEAVKEFDIERYMGRWYEIAFLPSRFQPRNGVDKRATYTLKPDGSVDVLTEHWCNGKWNHIHGVACKGYPKCDEAKFITRYWILSRQPKLDGKIYDQLVKQAEEQGYDVSRLHKVTHSDSPPGDEPNDTKRPWWLKSLLGK
ncbi:hypothetical protein DH2020_014253 [Rehmannia glutinosa]|uniref:Lipocalin/cytosolic fatty-acid binding domain-containing protein n=1 Tax=Rehmannia glutinosa TaxID=99300 RepID=A0ABR0WVW3_REHGL